MNNDNHRMGYLVIYWLCICGYTSLLVLSLVTIIVSMHYGFSFIERSNNIFFLLIGIIMLELTWREIQGKLQR